MLTLKPIAFFIAVLMFVSPSFAADAQPTTDSVKKLLALLDVQKQTDATLAQIGRMTSTLKETFRSQSMTPEQQKAADDMQSKMLALIKEELSWETMEPVYIKIYRESFTQPEVDDLIAFYQSPGGRALINKMPIVMQKTMTEMQTHMAPLMQKLQQLQRDTATQLKNPASEKPQ